MKVAFFIRSNHKEVGGGDLTQIYSTADGLRKIGIEVKYFSECTADISAYDIVHCFNSPRFEETKAFFENALRYNKPIAFSTIYWSKVEQAVGIANNPIVPLMQHSLGLGATKALWARLKHLQSYVKGDNSRKIEKWLFQRATILLPNSEGEERELERAYRLRPRKHLVVRNAIDIDAYRNKPTNGRKDYVLSVGRIERRKNTKKLIMACAKLELPLVLIGGADTGDEYVQDCMKLIEAHSFKYLAHMTPAKLLKYYYEARVHALVSWYETPGLSSMEAACGGCAIVSTDRGSTKEYFKDMVYYCDPFAQGSIEGALQRAWTNGAHPKLRRYILHNYTWDLAARDTLQSYQEALHV